MGSPGAFTGKYEATPLVVDGILYTVQAPNDVVAIDAVTGRIFWVLRICALTRSASAAGA